MTCLCNAAVVDESAESGEVMVTIGRDWSNNAGVHVTIVAGTVLREIFQKAKATVTSKYRLQNPEHKDQDVQANETEAICQA